MAKGNLVKKLFKDGTIQIPSDYLAKHNVLSFEISVEYGLICIKPFDANDIDKRPYIGIVRDLKIMNHTITIPIEFLRVLDCKPGQIFILSEENDVLKYRKM